MRAGLERRVRALQPGQLVPFLALALEVLWSYLWFLWISTWQAVGWSTPPLSLGSAVVLAMAGQALARFALGRNWSLTQVRLVVLPAMTFLLALVVRLELGGGYAIWDPGWSQYAVGHVSALAGGWAFGAYLVWRGMSVGREKLLFDDLYQKFVVGLVALVLLLVLWGITPGSAAVRPAASTAGLYVVAYFAAGLLAVALVNLLAIQEQMRRHQEMSGAFHRRWLSIAAGLVLGIVAASFALASAFSFDLAALVLHPLRVFAGWLLIAFAYAVGYPLGILAAALVYVLRSVVHLLRGGQPPEPIRPPDFSDLRRGAEEQQASGISAEAVLALKWGLLALLAVFALFLLARALFRYRKGKSEEGVEEVSESLWSLEAFKNELRSLVAWLVRWFRWFRRRPLQPPAILPPPMAVTEGDAPDRLFSIRELYRGLLWEGRLAGLPRRPPETPYEYGERLERGMGVSATQVEAITAGYVEERYGELRLTDARLIRLNQLWRQLLLKLRDKKTEAPQAPTNGVE